MSERGLTLDVFFEQGHVFSGGEEPPEPVSVVNADGNFAENWTERFDEADREHLSRYKTFDEFGKAHMSLTRKYKKDPDTMVEIPRAGSSDEVKAAWRKAGGVPDAVDAYEYKLSDELAVKLGPLKDDKMAAIREFAHKELELTPTKFTKLLDFYHTNIAGDIDAADISFNEQKVSDAAASKVELRTKDGWRSEEEYKAKVLRANAVMRKYGGEEAVEEFNAQNSPKMAVFLDNIAESMSEDTLKDLGPSIGSTRANIDSQITEIRGQMDVIIKENPSNFRGNIKFKELMTRKSELYVIKKNSLRK